MMNQKTLLHKLMKLAYGLGVLFLLTGMFLSAVHVPVMAQEETPSAPTDEPTQSQPDPLGTDNKIQAGATASVAGQTPYGDCTGLSITVTKSGSGKADFSYTVYKDGVAVDSGSDNINNNSETTTLNFTPDGSGVYAWEVTSEGVTSTSNSITLDDCTEETGGSTPPGNCAILGSPYEYLGRLDNLTLDSYTYTADVTIDRLVIKAGSNNQDYDACHDYSQDDTSGTCYQVSGLGTQSVTVTRVGSGPDCKAMSHIDFYHDNTPAPSLELSASCSLVNNSAYQYTYTVNYANFEVGQEFYVGSTLVGTAATSGASSFTFQSDSPDAVVTAGTLSAGPVDPSTLNCPPIINYGYLGLTFEQCLFRMDESGAVTSLVWRITNDHPYAVDFTWDIYGKGISGSGSVDANSRTWVEVPGITSGTFRLFVDGIQVNVKAGSAGGCQKQNLEINYSCNEESGGLDWTLTNPNNLNETFAYTLYVDDVEMGTGSIGQLETISLTHTEGGAHTVKVVWLSGYWTATASSSEEDLCEVVNPLRAELDGSGEIALCADEGEVTADFSYTLENLGDLPATLEVTVTSLFGSDVPMVEVLPLETLGEGSGTLSFSSAWAGVYPGNQVVEVEFTAVLKVNDEVKDTETVKFYYDPSLVLPESGLSMHDYCQMPDPQELVILEPVCNPENEDEMIWALENPNPWDVEYSFSLNGGMQQGPYVIPANARIALLATPLEQQTLTVFNLGSENIISRTHTIASCGIPSENPPYVDPPAVSYQPIIPVTGAEPTLEAPAAGGELLIPVTGADLGSALPVKGFLNNFFTCMGVLFLGIGMVMQGIKTRLPNA